MSGPHNPGEMEGYIGKSLKKQNYADNTGNGNIKNLSFSQDNPDIVSVRVIAILEEDSHLGGIENKLGEEHF